MARPKPEKVFGTMPSGEIFTGTKPEKPDRVNVFKTEPTGIVHTIEGYVKPDKPDRVNVFGVGSGREWITTIQSGASWDLDQSTFLDGERVYGVNHLTTYDLDGKSRCDWSGCQSQLWSSEQYSPQKTKFPYAVKQEQVCGYTDERTGKFVHKCRGEDRSAGKWYFEDELVLSYQGDKYRNNIFMDGYTGGKILMTKQEATDMGLTSQQVINFYFQDKLFKERAESLNIKPDYFFQYRSDGSIIRINQPEPEPALEPMVTPEPEMTLADPYANGMDHKEVTASTPESVPKPSRPDKEVDLAVEPESITTPEPLNLLPYAIVLGAVIGVGSVVMKKRRA